MKHLQLVDDVIDVLHLGDALLSQDLEGAESLLALVVCFVNFAEVADADDSFELEISDLGSGGSLLEGAERTSVGIACLRPVGVGFNCTGLASSIELLKQLVCSTILGIDLLELLLLLSQDRLDLLRLWR